MNAQVPKCLHNLSHFDQLSYFSLTNTTFNHVRISQKENRLTGEIIYKETSLIGKDNEHQKTDCWKKE